MPQSPTNATHSIVAPIIVTAELGPADQAWADALRRHHFPVERNHLAAHITLMHHLAPSLEGDLRVQLKALAREQKPVATIRGVYSLGLGVAIDLDSPDLLEIWARLADRFGRHLTPQDQHEPRLHITVQNKVRPAVARATLSELAATVSSRQISIAAVSCWHYRGGPWSLIGRYPFRG